MRVTTWMGKTHVEVQDVPDPKILNASDAIVKITNRDLRFRPAPLRRLHPDDARSRRCARSRSVPLSNIRSCHVRKPARFWKPQWPSLRAACGW